MFSPAWPSGTLGFPTPLRPEGIGDLNSHGFSDIKFEVNGQAGHLDLVVTGVDEVLIAESRLDSHLPVEPVRALAGLSPPEFEGMHLRRALVVPEQGSISAGACSYARAAEVEIYAVTKDGAPVRVV